MERNENLPFRYGDICFLPKQISQREVNNSALWFLRKNKERIKKEFENINIDNHFEFLCEIQKRYSKDLFDLDFFNKLPKKIQSYISTHNAIMNEDSYCIVPILPYTSYGYIILENEIIEKTINTLGLRRLFQVRQLGFMMNPILREIELTSNSLGFEHTRGLHSLDVVAVLKLIEINNPNKSLNSNLLSIGGVSHDGLTPAGSDTTKLVNLELFDEDTHYEELFQKDGWPSLREIYSIDEKNLKEMILNNGIHGQLLDIADKIAYTARDTSMFIDFFYKLDDDLKNERYRKLEKIVTEYPNFCDLWKEVKIIDGKMVIKDGLKLGRFLMVRALMYAELYYNPASRFLEYMLSKRIIKLLFENKNITRDELLIWTDHHLEEKIWEFLGTKYYPTSFKKSNYEKFENETERQKSISELKKDISVIAIPDDFQCVTKTGVNKYSVIKNGKIMIFKEAYPEMAKEIEKIMTIESNFGLYVVSLEDLCVPIERYVYLKEKLEY